MNNIDSPNVNLYIIKHSHTNVLMRKDKYGYVTVDNKIFKNKPFNTVFCKNFKKTKSQYLYIQYKDDVFDYPPDCIRPKIFI